MLLAIASATSYSQYPVVITQAGSTRAVAVNSVTGQGEPFALQTDVPPAGDHRTRVMIFSVDVEAATPLTVELKDLNGRIYLAKVESVSHLSQFADLRAITFQLSETLSEDGDILLTLVTSIGRGSTARIGVGKIGGGPPDVSGPVPYQGKLAQILFDGNSLMLGVGARQENSLPFLVIAGLGDGYDWQNFAVPGEPTGQMQQTFGKVDAQRHLTRSGSIVVAWEISNDLSLGATAEEAFDHYREYCLARRRAGFRVIAVTVLPRQSTNTPGYEERRLAVNQMLRDQFAVFAEGLIDVAAIPEIGSASSPSNKDLYADGTPYRCRVPVGGRACVTRDQAGFEYPLNR
jgi:hypothetical protein